MFKEIIKKVDIFDIFGLKEIDRLKTLKESYRNQLTLSRKAKEKLIISHEKKVNIHDHVVKILRKDSNNHRIAIISFEKRLKEKRSKILSLNARIGDFEEKFKGCKKIFNQDRERLKNKDIIIKQLTDDFIVTSRQMLEMEGVIEDHEETITKLRKLKAEVETKHISYNWAVKSISGIINKCLDGEVKN